MAKSKLYLTLINEAINKNNLDTIYGKSILITGGTGLIGATIVDILIYINEKLKKKIDIYVAGRNYERVRNIFTNYVEKDYFHYLKYDATKSIDFDVRFDYIIQGASNANPKLYTECPVETLIGNVIGVNNILEYSLNHGIKKLLYISSSEVYGNKTRNGLIVEDDYGTTDILDVRASYMSGKRSAENLCIGYLNEHKVPVVIARPGHIYGPHASKRDTRAASDFLFKASKGQAVKMLSAGNQLRSYCHAIDCASALLFLLMHGNDGQAYNISNKDSIVTIREFAECVSQIGNVDLEYGIGDSAAISYSALNSEKLENLGWNAVVSLDQGIYESIIDIRDKG